jgi:MSHA biogenesis protein MshJ
MKNRLSELSEKLEKLSPREKVLVGSAGVVVLVFVMQFFLIEPLNSEQIRIEKKVRTAQNLKQTLKIQLLDTPFNRNVATIRKLNVEVSAIEEQLSNLDGEIQHYAAALVPAKEMPGLLQVLLTNKSLHLVSIANVAPVPVIDPETEGQPGNGSTVKSPVLYRHGITIQLRGEYRAVIAYLETLEEQEWKLLWNSMKYTVLEYPMGKVDLHLQTLSTEERWLGV